MVVYKQKINRRTSLKWLGAMMGSSLLAVSDSATAINGAMQLENGLGAASPLAGEGYGGDPDLFETRLPWQKTLNTRQLDVVAALADIILPADERSPAASDVGVPDFIDEWVSAPYPEQQADRTLILKGLDWLEQQAVMLSGAGFAGADIQTRASVVDRMANGKEQPEDHAASSFDPHVFFRRFRYLVVGAYYTSEEGVADIEYLGNTPILGEYPGPSPAALAHLQGVLRELDLLS